MPAPTRRVLVTTAVVATVLLLAAAAAVPFRADAAWQEMATEVAALRADVAARATRREPLWGEPGPGNAHDHYAAAMALAHALQRDHHDDLLALLPYREQWTVAGREAVRERWQELLPHLRAGAAATDVVGTLLRETDTEPELATLLYTRWVVNTAVLEARALVREGRHLEAVRCTLDAATCAADLARTGPLIDQMIGCAVLSIATHAWPEAELARLDRPALDLLAAGLARLDESLPTTLDDRGDLLFTAWHLAHATGDAAWRPSRTDAWRFGFSTRWLLADAFLAQSARSERLAATTDAPWAVRSAALESEAAAAAANGNPLVATSLPLLGIAEPQWREVLAHLRLLRLAVDLHRGAPLPALVDPIGGGPITVTERDGVVELACEAIRDPARMRRQVAR